MNKPIEGQKVIVKIPRTVHQQANYRQHTVISVGRKYFYLDGCITSKFNVQDWREVLGCRPSYYRVYSNVNEIVIEYANSLYTRMIGEIISGRSYCNQRMESLHPDNKRAILTLLGEDLTDIDRQVAEYRQYVLDCIDNNSLKTNETSV